MTVDAARLERCRLKFRERFPEHYAQVEHHVMCELFPQAWLGREPSELPRIAQVTLAWEIQQAIAGLVKLGDTRRASVGSSVL